MLIANVLEVLLPATVVAKAYTNTSAAVQSSGNAKLVTPFSPRSLNFTISTSFNAFSYTTAYTWSSLFAQDYIFRSIPVHFPAAYKA